MSIHSGEHASYAMEVLFYGLPPSVNFFVRDRYRCSPLANIMAYGYPLDSRCNETERAQDSEPPRLGGFLLARATSEPREGGKPPRRGDAEASHGLEIDDDLDWNLE